MKRLSLAMSLAMSMWACGGSPTTPTAPAVPTRPTATLSGLVFAVTPTGLSPVNGARVRLEIGSYRQDALTDHNGRYRMTELYEGTSSVATTRDGYDTDTRTVTISGDVLLDIGIAPRIGHTLSGMVFEMTPSGRVLLDGVQVHWSDPHIDYYTASDGFFTFSEVFDGFTTLVASKDGYREVILQATVKGDTRFDIQLVRR